MSIVEVQAIWVDALRVDHLIVPFRLFVVETLKIRAIDIAIMFPNHVFICAVEI
jgi:hypothetical protein